MAPSRKPILVQFAMRIEAQPFLDHLGLKSPAALTPAFPFQVYETTLPSQRQLAVVVAGVEERFQTDAIGSVPATLLSYLAIQRFQPGVLINAGTAGGFESDRARIGEVLLGRDTVCFHSRRSAIPGMHEMGLGNYRIPDTAPLAQKLGLRRGIVSSGDALDCALEDLKLIQKNQATLKEMEAGPIGWICEKLRVPLVPIKSVTDLVDHSAPTHEQFMANYSLAVRELTDVLVRATQLLDQDESDPAWRFVSS